jgi:prepilin-type N-terminal cleavage/methylation domain-containing protein
MTSGAIKQRGVPWGWDGRARRAAFTLIEVLMAVLVLAVGLLGLAAVLPAVLKQQWAAADSVQGLMAARSCVAHINSKPALAATDSSGPGPANYTPVLLDERFWGIWANPYIDPDTGLPWRTIPTPAFPTGTDAIVTVGANGLIRQDALWMPLPLSGEGFNSTVLGVEVQAIINPIAPPNTQYQQRTAQIPLAERLVPHDSSGMRGPLFVWDLAIRRKARQSAEGPASAGVVQPPGYAKLQLAVFVRRVDPRIADLIPRTQTVFQNLTDRSLQEGRRNPVSIDANGNPTYDGRTTGGAEYSRPVEIPAVFTAGTDPFTLQEVRDIITILPPTPELFQLATQPGQILVDNLGNVYTVVGTADPNFGIPGVKVTPPVPHGVVGGGGGPNDNVPRLVQILFTPQIPAAVKVFEVNP